MFWNVKLIQHYQPWFDLFLQYVIGGSHEENPLFLGVQIHDKITNKWCVLHYILFYKNLKYLMSMLVFVSRSSPTVLGTGPKPCKAYSAIVLKQGRILVIKKDSASDDSIWFLEVSP